MEVIRRYISLDSYLDSYSCLDSMHQYDNFFYFRCDALNEANKYLCDDFRHEIIGLVYSLLRISLLSLQQYIFKDYYLTSCVLHLFRYFVN